MFLRKHNFNSPSPCLWSYLCPKPIKPKQNCRQQLVVKNLPANSGDAGSMPGSGKSPAEGHGNPLQCSCLENPMDRGAWRATVHKVAKSQTRLKQLSNAACTQSPSNLNRSAYPQQQTGCHGGRRCIQRSESSCCLGKESSHYWDSWKHAVPQHLNDVNKDGDDR